MSNVPMQMPGGGISRVTAGRRAPPLSSLSAYNVNRAGEVEGVWQPLYDYQTYPAAGTASSLVFFQAPIGAARTFEDTNMELGGQLPTPTEFLITSIGINFMSALPMSTDGPAATNADSNIANDVNAIMRRGFFRFTVGSKDYLRYTPLVEFPPAGRLTGFAAIADATTAAASLNTTLSYAQSTGPQFSITPIRLPASQNFRASIEFPNGAVALPSANATSRIGVILYGFLYRLSQ